MNYAQRLAMANDPAAPTQSRRHCLGSVIRAIRTEGSTDTSTITQETIDTLNQGDKTYWEKADLAWIKNNR